MILFKRKGRGEKPRKGNVKMNTIKLGMWVTRPNRKGVYLVADIEENYVTLKDVIIDKNGVISYGKKHLITMNELDNYVLA